MITELLFLAVLLILLFYDSFRRITVYDQEGKVRARPRLFHWWVGSGMFASLIGFMEEDRFRPIYRPLVAWSLQDYFILELNPGALSIAFCILPVFPFVRVVFSRAHENLFE